MRNVASWALARRAFGSFKRCRHLGNRKVGSALASIFLLFGLATQPAFAQLAVTPGSVDMGVAAPGRILETTLSIHNVGTTTAFADFITPRGQFWLQRTTCMLSSLGLAPGATCQAIVRFSAESACTYHADLQIYGWNGAQPDVFVSLTAAGAAGAAECTPTQYAANGRWKKVIGPYAGTNNYAGNVVTVADFGHDGEMDAVIEVRPYLLTGVPKALWHTERLTEVYVYTYTADGRFIDTTSRWFGVSPLLMPSLVDGSVADFNGDGKDDFAFATANEDGRPTYDPVTNENLWYVKNYAFMSTPTNAYNVQALGNISDYGFGSPSADIDGDGDIDILMSGQAPDPNSAGPGGMYMLLNDGSGAFTMGQVFIPTSAGSRPLSWPALGDLDGDGDPDLLIGRIRSGSFAVYENVSGTFHYVRDIAVFPGTYNASDDSYHVDLGYDTAEFEGVTGLGIADLDGDGMQDVVVYSGGVLDHQPWYGSMTFIRVAKGKSGLNFTPIGGNFSLTQRNQSARGQLLPLNGDSATDVILRSQSGAYPIQDAQLRNDGNGQLRYENLLAFPMVGFADTIHVADMNHDGRLDVVYTLSGPLDAAPGERGVMINTTPIVVSADRDFNDDGQSDILWRNTRTGADTIWKSGNSVTVQAVTGVTGQDWKIAGTGDFNGDGRADILWRNTATGANTIWKSANSATQQPVSAIRNLAWTVAGVGDFDGDGESDILWRNTSTGANTIWRSGNAATVLLMRAISTQAWQVVGTGDFNGDGKSDVLWRNNNTGANTIWKSANAATTQSMTGVTNLAWQIVGAGDFDGDGKDDVLWRSSSSGANTIWKSANAATTQSMKGVTNLAWRIADTGDYNGDGKDDVLWRNSSTGANTIWKSADASTLQAVTTVTDLAWVISP